MTGLTSKCGTILAVITITGLLRILAIAGSVMAFAVMAHADTITYDVSQNAIPTGSVPIEAFSFSFLTPNILVPSLGFPIQVTSESNFTFIGTPVVGFDLTSIILATNGTNTFFQVTLVNSEAETLVLNLLPNPESLLANEGVYSLITFPNLIVPGNPYTIVGDTGTGFLLITSGVPVSEPSSSLALLVFDLLCGIIVIAGLRHNRSASFTSS